MATIDSTRGRTLAAASLIEEELGYEEKPRRDDSPFDSQEARLLVVDDEESVAVTVSAVLREDGLEVDTALSGEEALALLRSCQYDLVLTDLHMEGIDGMSVLAELRRSTPLTIAVVLTGFASLESAIAAIRHGAYDYLIKPCVVDDLKLTIRRGLEHRRLIFAEREARATLEELNRELETRLDERTAEIQRVNAELMRANRAKDVFFATLSHELRSPLTPILGWAKILRHSSDPALLAQGLEAIERNVRLQTHLIDDLLDASRIVTGKLHLEVEPTDICDVVEAAVETVREDAAARNIEINVNMPHGPLVVLGAPGRLQQVVWNLLSNAIKFTPENGRVDVDVSETESELLIVVSDTGEGIAPEFLPNVFNLFAQADQAVGRHHGGLGLGLAIVRTLTESHGGSVSAGSEGLGRGSRFTVCLPRAAAQKLARGAETKPPSPDIIGPVLVVDDAPDTLDMMCAFFSHKGYHVLAADSAEEALRMAADEKPAVIISDLGMPGVDGFQLIAQLRSIPELSEIPAIAVSGHAQEEDLDRALASGFSAHVAKPIDPDELCSLINKLISR